MKVLQLHNKVPYPPKDGGAIGVWNFTLELANQGHDVTLLAMNTQKHYCDINNIPEKYTKLFRLIAVPVEAPVSAMGAAFNLMFSSKPYNAQRFISKEYRNKLIELLTKEEFDVIQVEGLYVVPYIHDIRMYSKALVSFKAHNIENEIWSRIAINETGFFKKKYLTILSNRIRRLETSSLQLPDVLVTVTDRDAQILNSMGNKHPYHIAPAGIDTSHLHPDFSKMKFPSVFYLGALDWAPNQEGLQWFIKNIWGSVHDKFPELKLEVAGRNAPDSFVKILQEPGIVYHGEIPDAYIFMNERAVMLVPLLSGSGMRVKIIEGMALGKTIITTSLGTEGINSTHYSDIIIANTPEEFIREIEKAITDAPFSNSIGKNAITFVEKNFNIAIIVKSLADFWKEHAIK